MGTQSETPSRRTGEGSILGTASSAKEIQYVVVESSASESKWCNFYFELLQHFSQWACMWSQPSARVDEQVQNADGQTRGGVGHQISEGVQHPDSSMNLRSSGVVREDGYHLDQGSACEAGRESDDGIDSRETVFPRVQDTRASDRGNREAVGSSSGSLFFPHPFDEHAEDSDSESFYSCDEPQLQDQPVTTRKSSSWCTAKSGAKWPKPRNRRRGRGNGVAAQAAPLLPSLVDNALVEAVPTPVEAEEREIVDFAGEWERCDWCEALVGSYKVTADDEVVCIGCWKQECGEDDISSLSSASEAKPANGVMCHMCEEMEATQDYRGMHFCESCYGFELRMSDKVVASEGEGERCDRCETLVGSHKVSEDDEVVCFGCWKQVGEKDDISSLCRTSEAESANVVMCHMCGEMEATQDFLGMSFCESCLRKADKLVEAAGGRDVNGKLLQFGKLVELTGLCKAKALNGSRGGLSEWQTKSGRWVVVMCLGGERKLVQPMNLRVIEPSRADHVNADDDYVCAMCTGPCTYEDRRICKACEPPALFGEDPRSSDEEDFNENAGWKGHCMACHSPVSDEFCKRGMPVTCAACVP